MSTPDQLIVNIPAGKGQLNKTSHTVILEKADSLNAELPTDAAATQPAAPIQKTGRVVSAGKTNGKAPAGEAPQRWIWSMLRTLTFTKNDYSPVLKGNRVQPHFPKITEGGGLAWLEPVKEGAEPTNSASVGYFVSAKGTPKILSVIWREFSENNDGKIITKQQKKFREAVQLHIYTEALYGQDLEITLLSHNLITSDDALAPYERTDGEAEVEAGKKTPKATIKTFQRQVKVYKILEDETSRGSALQVSDYMVKGKDGAAAQTGVTYQAQVQKAVVNVLLDPFWKEEFGDNLKIYASVKVVGKKLTQSFSSDYITVMAAKQAQDSPLMKEGNKPIVVGDVPVNPARFQPCKYSMIVVTDKDGDHKIFDENILDFKPSPLLTYNIVSGNETAKQTISLKLFNVVTNANDCHANPKHKDHVIDITALQKAGYRPENEAAGVKRPEEKKEVVKKGTETKFNNYKIKAESKSSYTGIMKTSDSELVFDAVYKYNFVNDAGDIDFARLWGYLWIPAAKADRYPVLLQSCRWQHKITFAIYPDIKWTVGLAFNMTKDQFEAIKNKFAEKNNGKGFKNTLQRFALKPALGLEKLGENIAEARNKKNELDPALARGTQKAGEVFAKNHNLPEKFEQQPGALGPAQDKGRLAEFIELVKKLDFSLKAEWNNDQQSVEPLQLIEKYYHDFMVVVNLLKEARKIIEGQYTQRPETASNDGQNPDAFIAGNQNSGKKSIEGLMKKLQRKPVDYELLFPKLGLTASWFYETMPPKNSDSELWGAGLSSVISLEAKPLLGLQLTWDFLELLCRRHPIAYAILKVVDGLLYVLADDESAIDIKLEVSGQVDLSGAFKHNTVGGNVFNRQGHSSPKKEELVTCKTAVQAKIVGKLAISKTSSYFKYEVVTGFGLGLEGSAGLGAKTLLGSDEQGMYVQFNLLFEGIKVEGYAEAKFKVSKEKPKKPTALATDKPKKDSLLDFNPKGNFEIAIDKKEIGLPKMYLTKKDS